MYKPIRRFGKKSSQTFTDEEGEQEKEDLTYNREDFWATTSNKQLDFVQQIPSYLVLLIFLHHMVNKRFYFSHNS
jgi:hypothetical protein